MAWTLAEIVMVVVIVLFVSLAGDNDCGHRGALRVRAGAATSLPMKAAGSAPCCARRAMLTLGALSYSIYMVHIFVQARMINVAGLVERKLGLGLIGDIVAARASDATGFGTGSPWIGLVAIVAMLIATIAASWFTWRFVEMPAMAWFRRLSKRI